MINISLHHLIVRDFKSFNGEFIVGPFDNFSGIVGPNGAGKSNVLDALAFVLYLDASPRSTNYIHQGEEEIESCSVKVFFEIKEKGDVMHQIFERQYFKSKESKHFINDQEVEEANYIKAIREFQIVPLAFVKQADVDVVARKTPLELTQLFEEMSGSAQYADDYDRLKLDTESSHEAVSLLDKRRRAALSEKRHISARKEEAAKYRSLASEEEKLQIEMALFQLYHGKNRVAKAEEENDAHYAQKLEMTTKVENASAKLRRMENEANKTHDEYLNVDSRYQEIEQQLRNVRANRLRENEKFTVISERLESTKNKIESNSNALTERENNLNEMRNEREQIIQQMSELPVVEKLEKEIDEYNSLRERASQQFSDVTNDLRAAVQERNAAQRELDDIISQKDSEEASCRKIQDSINSTKEELKKTQSRLAQIKKEIQNVRTGLSMKQHEDSVDVESQNKMMQRMRDQQKKLEEIRRSKGTNKRKEKLKKAIQSMQRLFKGVYGRFFDLCKPAHQNYNMAVFAGAGGHADSIIVRDKEVAIKCIDYLKEQGAGQALFLPLNSLAQPKIHLKSSVKMLSAVMRFDKMYKPAVDYVCGSIALCDNLTKARELAFRENIQTVTLDGSIVDPSGVLTGGKTKEEPHFENISTESLENDIAQLERNLATLGDQIEKRRNEIENDEEQLLSLEPQQKHIEMRKKDLEERIKILEVNLRNTQRQITSTQSKIKTAQTKLNIKNEYVQNMDLKQAEIDKSIFRDFCLRTGVQDIREFEVTRLQNFEERYAKRLQLQSRLSQIENFIALEEKRDPQSSIDLLLTRKDELEAQLEETQNSLSSLNEQYEQLTKEYEEIKQQRTSLIAEDESNRQELKNRRRKNQDLIEQLEQINDSYSAIEHEKETAMQSLSSILQQCKLTNIQLPHLNETEEVEMTNTPSSFTQEINDKRELETIDFSKLSAAKRAAVSQSAYNQAVSEYQNRLAEIHTELNQIRPDLKSDDRYTEVEKELNKMIADQDQYKKKANENNKALEEIKRKRRDTFMKLYDAVDKSIDKIYKNLTRAHGHESRGGTAYLVLDDTEEPYLGGIKFTAMPPHKRFRDLEQLSGGEKAVASLALILALQKEIGAPFILMDEPDASLDKLNLKSASIALREMASTAQIISVSLRDRFFEHADVLIGIYKDMDRQSSGVVTLNLKNFVEQNLVMEDIE